MDANDDRVTVWQCIGCGRIEAPQPCIGVCRDRKVEFVHADRYDEVVAELTAARREVEALGAVVRQLAVTIPRGGEWERTYRALQERARRTLGATAMSPAGNESDREASRIKREDGCA